MKTSSVRSVGLTTAVLLSLFILLSVTEWMRAFPFLYDFGAYYQTGGRLAAKVSPYYPLLNELDWAASKFLYLPLFGLIFVPFSYLPFYVAGSVWTLLNVGAITVGVISILRSHDIPIRSRVTVYALVLLIGYYPLVLSLSFGQITPLLTAAFCGAYVFKRRANSKTSDNSYTEILSSILTVVPGLIKPPYFAAGLHLIRRRRRLLAALSLGIGVVLFSLLLLGPEWHVQYVDIAFGHQSESGFSARKPVQEWIPSTYVPFYWVPGPGLFPKLSIVLATGAVGFLTRSTEDSDRSGLGVDTLTLLLGVASVPLVMLMGDAHGLVALVPVLLVLGLELFDTGYFWIPLSAYLLIEVQLLLIGLIRVGTVYDAGPLGTLFSPNSVTGAILSIFIPLVQPAMWATYLLYGYLLFRAFFAWSRRDVSLSVI